MSDTDVFDIYSVNKGSEFDIVYSKPPLPGKSYLGGGQSPAHWAGDYFFGRGFSKFFIFGSEKRYLIWQNEKITRPMGVTKFFT